MSIWGKIIGGTAGFALGGPLGAILGVMAGNIYDKSRKTSFKFQSIPNNQKQNIFALSIIILAAKLAKADGVVTKDEIADVQNLNMDLEVNNKKMQKGNTSKMIFNINYVFSYLSNFMSLQPGDIITTGTPFGVGMGMKPPTYLKSGDEIKLSIDDLGEQFHKVKTET